MHTVVKAANKFAKLRESITGTGSNTCTSASEEMQAERALQNHEDDAAQCSHLGPATARCSGVESARLVAGGSAEEAKQTALAALQDLHNVLHLLGVPVVA